MRPEEMSLFEHEIKSFGTVRIFAIDSTQFVHEMFFERKSKCHQDTEQMFHFNAKQGTVARRKVAGALRVPNVPNE